MWLQNNYDFSKISYSIDELVVLDVSREKRNVEEFSNVLKIITSNNFVPITAGGGVRDIYTAHKLLRSGADKILINSSLFTGEDFVKEISSEFGQQCVVASLDFKRSNSGKLQIWSENGSRLHEFSAEALLEKVLDDKVGEVYLNSMDRDGTGQGLDFSVLELLPKVVEKPIILAGGVGNSDHILAGLHDSRIDAVATANLFNFVGNGLSKARTALVSNGIALPLWSPMSRKIFSMRENVLD